MSDLLRTIRCNTREKRTSKRNEYWFVLEPTHLSALLQALDREPKDAQARKAGPKM